MLTCVVVTPEQTALEEQADFVVVPMIDGELGVAKGRTPLIGRLGKGELRLRTADGAVQRYYVEGGFVQIHNDLVALLTSGLKPAQDLDLAQIEKQLDDARSMPGNSAEAMEARREAVDSARAQMLVARRS